jgi:TrmH family RNA methyltransferase
LTLITSLQNPKVKAVVGLRERRERTKVGLMVVEGFEELSVALASNLKPVELYYCPELFREKSQSPLLDRLRHSKTELVEVNARVFEKIAYRDNPDGWLATFPAPRRSLNDLTLSQNPFLVVAQAVEKPGNLGAMLRTTDAANVDGVISCDPATDWGNPNVVRASKGALFTVQVAEAKSAETIRWLREKQIKIVVATPQATLAHTQADLTGPVAIAVGTEKQGLTDEWLAQADEAVVIPMFGRVNSLNVSTSTAILVYEVIRQRSS